jgi:hypothetical protein
MVTRLVFTYSEDGNGKLFLDAGKFLPDHTASHPRKKLILKIVEQHKNTKASH